MELHRIAVISDTHGLLRPEVSEELKSCEAVLHAGDFDKADILEKLRADCPVWAVRGNVDKEWADSLPEELETELYGFRLYIIHNRKHIRKDLSGIDIVVYGHSHKYEERREDGILYLNPGSCGPKRFRLPVTMAVLTLYPEEHRIEVERIDCVPAVSFGQKGSCSAPVSEACRADNDYAAEEQRPGQDIDMHKLVKAIIKDVRAGRTVAGIAARHHIKEELAEEICRYYVTHPGVDVDGILDRMERKNL